MQHTLVGNGRFFKDRSGWRKEMPKWTDVSGKLHQKVELIWVLKGEQGTGSRK